MAKIQNAKTIYLLTHFMSSPNLSLIQHLDLDKFIAHVFDCGSTIFDRHRFNELRNDARDSAVASFSELTKSSARELKLLKDQEIESQIFYVEKNLSAAWDWALIGHMSHIPSLENYFDLAELAGRIDFIKQLDDLYFLQSLSNKLKAWHMYFHYTPLNNCRVKPRELRNRFPFFNRNIECYRNDIVAVDPKRKKRAAITTEELSLVIASLRNSPEAHDRAGKYLKVLKSSPHDESTKKVFS